MNDKLMRVLLADDHALVRETLADYLVNHSGAFEVHEAEDWNSVEAALADNRQFGLIILDYYMPGMNGRKSVARLKKRRPKTPLVILSGASGSGIIAEVLAAGADGFVPKSIKRDAFVNALNLILSGEKFVPSSYYDAEPAPGGGANDTENEAYNLTPREHDILHSLEKGWSNKEIARELGLQEVTIKAHLQSIYRKLGVSNRSQALAFFLERERLRASGIEMPSRSEE